MGTNTMALIQTCQIQATAVKLQCCHIWQVELSKLSLLQLSFSIHSSNGVSCPIKFFHLKIAIGLALGDSWGVACASTEQHWCPVSTFACFAGKAFLGKPAKITFGENKEQGCQLHQKQEWSMEFCCSCFRVQMHKPLVHDSQRASIYHQGTEASLLELRRFMTLRGDSPNTTGWPPLVFQGLAPMDQLSKSRTKTNLQAKYRTPQMPLAARHWFSEGSKSRFNKLHKATKSCSRQTTTSTKSIVSRNLTIHGWERKLTNMNWMEWSMMDEL